MYKSVKFSNFILLLLVLSHKSYGLPLNDELLQTTGATTIDSTYSKEINDTKKNVYVVKATVYEVGILTEVDDNETATDDYIGSQERVDLTFFDAHSNKSHIDLGTIPLPVQTNVSGQVLTAIAPVDLGAFSNVSELLHTLPLTGAIVNITKSDTGFIKFSSANLSNEMSSWEQQNQQQQQPQPPSLLPLKMENGELLKITDLLQNTQRDDDYVNDNDNSKSSENM